MRVEIISIEIQHFTQHADCKEVKHSKKFKWSKISRCASFLHEIRKQLFEYDRAVHLKLRPSQTGNYLPSW